MLAPYVNAKEFYTYKKCTVPIIQLNERMNNQKFSKPNWSNCCECSFAQNFQYILNGNIYFSILFQLRKNEKNSEETNFA